MARVNYQHQKRMKDLERQRKQEEKRNRRLHRDQEAEGVEPEEAGIPGDAPEGEAQMPSGLNQ